MNLARSASEDQFVASVRAWLADNVPASPPPFEMDESRREYDTNWQRSLWDGGWGGLGWPEDYGGRDASTTELVLFYEELARAGAPDAGTLFTALNHAAPTLLAWGSHEQKQRHLTAILRGEQVWCQGFSESEAGSDLASLRTHGRIDGDSLIVTGTKIWTSYAHIADFAELLVRTGSAESRHRGLTWVILDMRSEGVQVRPIPTLTGQTRFSEVRLDEVRVPLENVVGGLDDGWRVALSTLEFERGRGMLGRQLSAATRVRELYELARQEGVAADSYVQRCLARLDARARALRAMCYAGLGVEPAQRRPGMSSVLRVYHAEFMHDAAAFGVELLGPRAGHRNRWTTEYLNELRSKITAGTLDIQRNVIGERALGLPR